MKLTRLFLTAVAALGALTIGHTARASIAYGSINNFDVVNDTGTECHGFEIELEDTVTTDITYTYDWNHYNKSKFSSGFTAGGKPATFVRWESAKNPDGTWAAFTAIPAGPIAPTDGHQFTDPSVNFGGEHFGCGYSNNPTAVRYFWLIDNGSGTLVRGPEVQVATPVFNYAPPVAAQPAQVQAVIAPPAPPVPPPREFGDAVWIKEIKTKTHNANKVALRDLISDDPNDAHDKNWRNGEPDEIEVEWRILQIKTNAANGGPRGELAAAPEGLKQGNEVVTRRYEFFKYTGPLDAETNEAMADAVGADGVHGKGSATYADHFDPASGEFVTVTTNFATIEVVGDYIGAQMSAFDANGEVGLIDVVPDGELGVEYPARTVIVAGLRPFTATVDGVLPVGMTFDTVSGVLSGLPEESGTFSFSVTAADGVAAKTQSYTLVVTNGVAIPPQSTITTNVAPANSGTTTGDGIYDNGMEITVTATANDGFVFVNWTDNGVIVSDLDVYTFTTMVNRLLTANFAPVTQTFTISTSALPADLGVTAGDGVYAKDGAVTVTAAANAGAAFVAWTEADAVVSTDASYTFTATADRALVANFVAIRSITTSASPSVGGTTSGDGIVNDGSNTTVTAAANPGYVFVNWTVGGAVVSVSVSYSFTVTSDRVLVANFAPVFTISTASAPAAGGSTSGGGSVAGGASVTVVATSNPGYSFVNWTEAGAAVSTNATYTFTASADRTLVANFQTSALVLPTGLFKGIVANLASPVDAGTGMMTVTVGKAGAYTGTLALGAASYPIKGTLDQGGHSNRSIVRKGRTPLAISLQVDPASGLVGTVGDGTFTSNFTARRCPYSKATPLTTWPGTFTHVIGFPRKNRPALPVGVGTHTINSLGAVVITGKLSDGSTYACSTYVTDAGTFPFRSPTKMPGFTGFVVGDVALNAANLGGITAGSPVTWKPATPQAFGRFQFFADRYVAPARGKTALKVDLGVPNLGVLATNAIGGMLNSWQMRLGTNNVATDLHAGPGPISLQINAAKGGFSGKLHDGAAVRPFNGVVFQSSNSGFGILPGFGDQASLTLVPTYTGP